MIELQAVGKAYPTRAGGEFQALRDVSLEIRRGEVFGIIGASGAGKSTLLRLINGLERTSSGRVLVDGQEVCALAAPELKALRRRIGMIFQSFGLLSSKTVAGNVAFPLRLAGLRSRAEIRARVAELLERVGLADQASKYPAQLSGGQKQRVGIARALATGPDILLCDEATSALDPLTTRSILRLIAELNRELGLTVVLITHEIDVVRQVCDRVAVLEAGRVVETGPTADVVLHPSDPVTQRLIAETDPEAGDAGTVGAPEGSTVVRLTYRGETAYGPFLSRVGRETDTEFSILSGRISRIKDTPYGELTVALLGANAEDAIRRLRAAEVRVEPV